VAKWRFCRGFAIYGAQNVVNCVVKRGGTVVKVWLETTANRATKNMPVIEYLFQ
jgi:hypothetical protein